MLNRGKEEQEEEQEGEIAKSLKRDEIGFIYQDADTYLIKYMKWSAYLFICVGFFSAVYAFVGKFSFASPIGNGEFAFYFSFSPLVFFIGWYLQRKKELLAVSAYNNKRLTWSLYSLPVLLSTFYIFFIFIFSECFSCIWWTCLLLVCFIAIFAAYKVYQRLETKKKTVLFENLENGKYKFSSKITEDTLAIPTTTHPSSVKSMEDNFEEELKKAIDEN